MTDLVLSLFPGIGMLDMAFEEQGFCVVRGPDVLWGGDVKRFHPPAGRFDGIIGGPPCQAFSRLRHIVEHNGYKTAENLIPEFERCVAEAQPAWFVMENVPEAPEPVVAGYAITSILVNNRWFGSEQNRRRRFAFGLLGEVKPEPWRYIQVEPLESVEWAHAVVGRGGRTNIPVALNGGGKPKRSTIKWVRRELGDSLRLQGLPEDFLDKAPFTMTGKHLVVGNGVPLPTGRAIAQAVRAMVRQREGIAV